MAEERTPSPHKEIDYREICSDEETSYKPPQEDIEEEEEKILFQALSKMTPSQLLHETLKQIEERLFILKHEEGRAYALGKFLGLIEEEKKKKLFPET